MTQQNSENKLDRQTPAKAAADGSQETTAAAHERDTGAVDPQQDDADASPAKGARSESLLPAANNDAADDESFHVAEEVSLDQQSDRVRQIGNLPEDGVKTASGSVADAMAEAPPDPPDDDPPGTGKPAPRTSPRT